MVAPVSESPTTLVAASTETFFLAESPVWDAHNQRAMWTDIAAGNIHSADLRPDGTLKLFQTIHSPDTAAAVAVSETGEKIVAGERRVWLFSPDGTCTGGPQLIDDGEQRMLNDGAVDPFGRFLVGTLHVSEEMSGDRLVRLERNGEITTIDSDLSLSNGIDWSTDGETMYNVDTLTGRVFRRRYAEQMVGHREVFCEFDDGFPDGLCVDSEDHVWVAVWGGGEVRRFDPAGQIVSTIVVPVPHVSSVAFVGPELDTLVITTAQEGLSSDRLREVPESGRVFTTKPGVRGKQSTPWCGSSLFD